MGLFDHSISFEQNKYMNLGMIASTIIPVPVPYNHLDKNMKQIKLLKYALALKPQGGIIISQIEGESYPTKCLFASQHKLSKNILL